MAQRLGIDLALVVLAVIALWQLRLYGAPLTRNARGALGVDPLLVAAPAIGLLAGAVLATRLIPRLAEIGERVLGRRPRDRPPLGARQVARRPLRYTRSALLLVLAAALGTFAAASAATWARSQVDQAAYRAAGDVRVVLSDYPDAPRAGRSGRPIRSLPGVTAATPVSTQSLDIGRTVRGRSAAGGRSGCGRPIVRSRPRRPRRPGSPRPAGWPGASRATGIPLDGSPRRLARDARRRPHDRPGRVGRRRRSRPTGRRSASAFVMPATATAASTGIEAGTPGLEATTEPDRAPARRTVAGLPIAPAGPLAPASRSSSRCAAAEHGDRRDRRARRACRSSPTRRGDDWTPVAFDPGRAPAGRGPAGGADAPRPTARRPDRRAGSRSAWATSIAGAVRPVRPAGRHLPPRGPAGGDDGRPGDRRRPAAGADRGDVGDTIAAISAGAQPLTVRIVGSAPSFPPLDPDGAVPRRRRGDARPRRASPRPASRSPRREWWLSGRTTRRPRRSPRPSPAAPYSAAEVIRRTELAQRPGRTTRSGSGSSARSGSARSRRSCSPRSASSSGRPSRRASGSASSPSSGRSACPAGSCRAGSPSSRSSCWLSGSSGARCSALLLAWLVLPYSTLSATGAAVVPRPVIVVPWEAIVPVYVVIGRDPPRRSVSILARQVPERRVSRVLRAGDV